jgi:AbiU2
MNDRPRELPPLNDRLERAAHLIVRCRIFFDIWFYFEGKDTRPAISDTMRRFSEFFRYDPEAHFVSFLILIAALFDKERNTISIWHLEREARRSIRTADAEEVCALLAQATPLATKVTFLRNKVVAHRSATISYDDAFEHADVTPDQLRDLTELALKIVNRLLRARGCANYFFDRRPLKHAAAMLKALAASPP